ncbi:alkaline phosphatase PhoX [Kineobactrum salinum]|uniref:alkaline phosphatase PhoX n=1 Tax=Kineobactrum salinum TaxID=2708301 RepID=UPI0018D8EA31|nr:alkaline phosphatase PhoX [Kineobactrum salinum]
MNASLESSSVVNDATEINSEPAVQPIVNRRDFMKGGAAGAAAISFGALASGRANAFTHDYGPVAPVADEITGLPLLQLPEGFKYWSYGWQGQIMQDGTPTPGVHDGMGVVASQGNNVVMVRNHEIRGGGDAVPSSAMYNAGARGGCSNLVFDTFKGRWLASYMSISGTSTNCAGGVTPWGTWLTAEETTASYNGKPHGWIFEVPGFGLAKPEPIKAMGRRAHEATATDPVTGYVYITEDAGSSSGFYRFRPNEYGKLHAGGVLEMLKIKGTDNAPMANSYADGTSWEAEWVVIDDPESINPRNYTQGADKGAARFARLEGCWYDTGLVYFTSTSGGGISRGQVFAYEPRRETLTLIFETRNQTTHPVSPDNLTISPRGGILICEDRSGPLSRLIGLNQMGDVFEFARNNVELSAADIALADGYFPGVAAAMSPGSYTGAEWCGATFHDRWLFANVQSPGITFAITGPWNEGIL